MPRSSASGAATRSSRLVHMASLSRASLALASFYVRCPTTSSPSAAQTLLWRGSGDSPSGARWVDRSRRITRSPAPRDRAGMCWRTNRLFQVLQVGDRAPEFKLPTTSGQELTLAGALEKYRALVFL